MNVMETMRDALVEQGVISRLMESDIPVTEDTKAAFLAGSVSAFEATAVRLGDFREEAIETVRILKGEG
jgi:hypothetical protein